ncbi:MAG: S1 RNA-binding domain-containing protein [Anaerolineales bacterium]
MTVYSLDGLQRFIVRARELLAAQTALEPGAERSVPLGGKAESARVYPLSPELAQAWDELEHHYAQGDTLSVIVTGWNRGGLLVRWGEVQGFVPASQLKQVPLVDDESQREELLIRWVGEELDVKIIELDSARNRLVFSERATQWGPTDGIRLLEELNEGDVCRGRVSNVCDFGAFVDLGGLDGLIHISELSWGRVTTPGDLLHIGDEVQECVLSVDRSTRHVGLSLKRLQPNPWALAEQHYQVGDVVEATVTNVVDFGLFAQIEEGLEGLVHISEISDEHIRHPADVASAGDRVLVSILRIDSTRHRLSLSMKRANGQGSTDDSDASDDSDDGGPAMLLY